MIQDTIRGYELQEQLASGGFGAVYRAYQPSVGREVAIKVIRPEYADHPDFIRRFETEAQLVARLEHPHIVPLYDYWREPGGAYLVMRLLRGRSLKDELAGGALSPARTLAIVEQLAGALDYAHAQGVIHRDLKPGNVLLDDVGNAYLSDFGIAKGLGEADDLTQTMGALGSPRYMAPEQILGEPVTPATDLYCLGLLVYALLSGEVPYPDETYGALVDKQLHQPLPALRETHPEFPLGIDEVLSKATAKQPGERYPSALDFLRLLRGVITGEGELPEIELVNPYKGLRPFLEADAGDFFGRAALTERLLERLKEADGYNRFLAVVGPSGSGKSSVVRAGLIPRLKRGALPGSEDWYVVELLPGAYPFEELELGLLRVAFRADLNLSDHLSRDERGLLRAARLVLPDAKDQLLLVIDQFEELFTQVQDPAEARRFLDSLYTAVTDDRSTVRVVITLRADFYDRPLMYPDFAQLIQARTEVVVPMTADELEQAVRSPGERAGAAFDAGLVTHIVGEVIEQPGALPLLQYALTELFERREGRRLPRSTYELIGSVTGSLGRRAEETFSALSGTQQSIAKQVFLRLVTLGEGVEDTRRRVLLSELESLTLDGGPASQQVKAVVDIFGKARLLSFDRDPLTRTPTVDVAHEALLRKWVHLREWLDESRADLRMQRVLANLAWDWIANDREDSFLLRGSRLEQYAGWAEVTSLALTESEQAYLAASLVDEEARKAQRAKLETIGLAGMALNELHGRKPERAVPLALEAVENYPYTWQAQRALGMAVLNHKLEMCLRHGGRVNYMDLSADGKHLLTSSEDGKLHIWDTRSGVDLVQIDVPPAPNAFWSPDESRILVLCGNDEHGWCIQIRDGSTGELQHSRVVDSEYWLRVGSAKDSWSPDNQRFTTGHSDGTMRIWDAASGKELMRIAANQGPVVASWSPAGDVILTDGAVWDADSGKLRYTLISQSSAGLRFRHWSPDGDRFIMTEPGRVCVYETATGDLLQELSIPGSKTYDAKFSPDGTQIITTSSNQGNARLWNAQTGELQGLIGSWGEGWAIAWVSDGRLAAVGGHDGQVHLWNPIIGIEMESIPFIASNIDSIEWSPDGERLFVASSESAEARVYRPSRALFKLPGMPGIAGWSGWSPDGQQVSTIFPDGTVNVYQADTQELLFSLDAGDDVGGVAWSSFGDRILTWNQAGPIRIWDASNGELLAESPNSEDCVWHAAWSPDGSQIAITSCAIAKVFVLDAVTFEELNSHNVNWGAQNVSWSPDGKRIAETTWAGEATIRDAATGEVLLELFPEDHKESAWAITWTRDGQQVIVFSIGTGYRFDANTGEELMRYIGHSEAVSLAALSPDEQLLYALGGDGTARVFDVATGVELQVYELGGWLDGALSPDGTRLLLRPTTGEFAVYPVWQTLDELVAYAKEYCLVYELTPTEREQFGLPPVQ